MNNYDVNNDAALFNLLRTNEWTCNGIDVFIQELKNEYMLIMRLPFLIFLVQMNELATELMYLFK